MNIIVTVNVTQTVAPAPSQLQRTGALISQGGTTTAPGTKTLLTAAGDLTAVKRAPLPLASLSQAAGLATATMKSTTVASGTYDTETGVVTLTLTATISQVEGQLIKLSSIAGTGSVASCNVTAQALAGSAGTTLKYQIATGLTLTITDATGDAEVTTGLAVDATFWTTIAGAAQSGYNGNKLATVTGDTTFTFAVASTTVSPATGTPTATPPGTTELQQMVTSFFGQGTAQAVYVLEEGQGTAAEGVAYLSTWIAANPGVFYSYCAPRSWAGAAEYRAFVATFEAPTAKTYFYTTMTTANYTSFTALMKDVKGMIESPDAPSTEFSIAAWMQNELARNPSTTNKVPPASFTYLFGVTPYPEAGNSALFATLKAAGVNIVGTGAQGGISDAVLFWGTGMDGRDSTYWYSVDWVQINGARDIANAVINGSNTSINPLYYNQDGINRLQAVLVGTMNRAVTYGLALGQVVQTQLDSDAFSAAIDAGTFDGQIAVNAVPFIPYSAANPGDYADGIYNGLADLYTPARGFTQILFNLNVSEFVTQ